MIFQHIQKLKKITAYESELDVIMSFNYVNISRILNYYRKIGFTLTNTEAYDWLYTKSVKPKPKRNINLVTNLSILKPDFNNLVDIFRDTNDSLIMGNNKAILVIDNQTYIENPEIQEYFDLIDLIPNLWVFNDNILH